MNTPASNPPIAVAHNPGANRFEATVDGHLCVADYRLNGNVLQMTHTVVPRAVEGRGIAAALVSTTLAWARSQRYAIDPQCSYVRVYMQRHPETQDLLKR